MLCTRSPARPGPRGRLLHAARAVLAAARRLFLREPRRGGPADQGGERGAGVGAAAVGRAEVVDDAPAALRSARGAAVPAVEDQQVARKRPVFAADAR